MTHVHHRLLATALAVSLAVSLLAIAPIVAAQPVLSPGRQLRRITMTLLDRPPTIEELSQLGGIAAEDGRDAWLAAFVDRALASPEFARVAREWGHELMRVGIDPTDMDHWDGTRALDLGRCGAGTVHAGALIEVAGYGDSHDDACNAGPVAEVEPWWAPGTTERVVGDLVVDPETDPVRGRCGSFVGLTGGGIQFDSGSICGCGPNLIYCTPWRTEGSAEIRFESGYGWLGRGSPRRALFEEPARMVEHVITTGAPWSDLVIGDYTVVNRALHHLYVRHAMFSPEAIGALADDQFWREYRDDYEYRAVPFDRLDPHLISDRHYRYDPRTATEPPRGVPSAGLLTAHSMLSYFPRERVRAARMLETFACRDFSPPPAGVTFPRYVRDPALEGTCLHCHQLIDPAAIYFKRFLRVGRWISIAGFGFSSAADDRYPGRHRVRTAYSHDTFMTPVDEATIARDPNSALIDFLPSGGMFGTDADGTIGPLGLGRMLVESGEFDRCAVRQAHRRFRGHDLIPGRDDQRLTSLVESFTSSERDMRALIRTIVLSDDFRQGF
jgi:hypothetical protein